MGTIHNAPTKKYGTMSRVKRRTKNSLKDQLCSNVKPMQNPLIIIQSARINIPRFST